ncbi:MAG: cysteine dioxygenase [Planctomycetota bacterium]|jgi:cysteine dioxygenase
MVDRLRESMLQGPAGVDRPFTRDELLKLAQAVDLESLDLGDRRRFNEARYARNSVFENDQFELVVICWRPGQASAIHDHGQSLCLYLVVQGEFEERLYELDPDGEPRQTGARRWRRGDITISGGPDVHALHNEGPEDLVTIHIYSPPLRQTSKNFTPVPRTA